MNWEQILLNLGVMILIGVPCYLGSFFVSKKYAEKKEVKKNEE